MVHRYLKTCVLSVCVAALCGGRAFGVWFGCEECNKPILGEKWGSHCVEFQHGNKMPEYFVCNRCYVKGGEVFPKLWYKDGGYSFVKDESGKKVLGKDGHLKMKRILSFEEHVQNHHPGGCCKCTFWCTKCEVEIGANSWIMHLYGRCKCYDKIYKFEGSGFEDEEEIFRCLLCEEKEGKEVFFPLILKYEHLRDKHPKYLPKREYFCEDCGERVSEADRQEHNKEKHAAFYCLICEETQKECYEDHMARCHNGKCPFCEETFSEKNRKQHMAKNHGFPCPICNEQVDTLFDVHVHRQHPYFEGPCRCQKFQNGVYRPCEYPSYLVTGKDYLLHLNSGAHGVGEHDENIGSFFVWCSRRDFMGPCKEAVKHASSKHKGCFFYCPKSHQLDFDCSNEEWHLKVRHDRTHWWCKDCANIIEYESKDENERSASRIDHLLTVHKNIYDAVCPVCSKGVLIKDLDTHVRKKHPGKNCFWCFACNACKRGDQSEHMKVTHSEYSYCEICGTWVSNLFAHRNEEHKDCFFCRLCLKIFKNRVEHIKGVHPGNECACGPLLSYEVDESWHVAMHSIWCPLCKKECPSDHMVTAHKCKKGVCKPIVNKKKRVWEWECDPFCKTLARPCPLSSWGCQFTGKTEQLNLHMLKDHNCEKTCCFDESEKFVHDAFCKNGPAVCSICWRNVENREPHCVKEHGCKEGCLVASGKGKWHHGDCKEWTLEKCLMCYCAREDSAGEDSAVENYMNVDRNHIFKKHFPDCGEKCSLIQKPDGWVYIGHHGHKKEEEEEIALQDGEVCEEEEIEEYYPGGEDEEEDQVNDGENVEKQANDGENV